MPSQSHQHDSRICLSSKDLIRQRSFAKGFVANPRAAINNQFVGRHYSSQRGRGLNFEELSHYRIGDDTRSMDWKVTNRTGKPHVRVFTEERERPIMLVCDQRQSMFFGSEHKMKSVIAAEAMSLFAWRHIALGDAVASLLFNDTDEFDSKPHRSNAQLLKDFEHLSTLNRSLLQSTGVKPLSENSVSLQRTLARLNTLCAHDYVIVLISDLYGINERARLLLKSLSLRNDLIIAHVSDRAELSLQDDLQFIAGNGQQQLAVNTKLEKLAARYTSRNKREQEAHLKFFRSLGVPLITLNTSIPTHEQLRSSLPDVHPLNPRQITQSAQRERGS